MDKIKTDLGRCVFTGTADWWQIVSQRGEIELDDDGWNDTAAIVAELNCDCEESWVSKVTEVDPRHTAIRVGDYACSDGIGDDVIFVRLTD